MNTKIDIPALRAAIVAHPWSSLALAFVAGGWLAGIEPRGRMARGATRVFAALAVATLREIMPQMVARSAKSWTDERVRQVDADRRVS